MSETQPPVIRKQITLHEVLHECGDGWHVMWCEKPADHFVRTGNKRLVDVPVKPFKLSENP